MKNLRWGCALLAGLLLVAQLALPFASANLVIDQTTPFTLDDDFVTPWTGKLTHATCNTYEMLFDYAEAQLVYDDDREAYRLNIIMEWPDFVCKRLQNEIDARMVNAQWTAKGRVVYAVPSGPGGLGSIVMGYPSLTSWANAPDGNRRLFDISYFGTPHFFSRTQIQWAPVGGNPVFHQEKICSPLNDWMANVATSNAKLLYYELRLCLDQFRARDRTTNPNDRCTCGSNTQEWAGEYIFRFDFDYDGDWDGGMVDEVNVDCTS